MANTGNDTRSNIAIVPFFELHAYLVCVGTAAAAVSMYVILRTCVITASRPAGQGQVVGTICQAHSLGVRAFDVARIRTRETVRVCLAWRCRMIDYNNYVAQASCITRRRIQKSYSNRQLL